MEGPCFTRRQLYSVPSGSECEIMNRVIDETGSVTYEPCRFRIVGQSANFNPRVAEEMARPLMGNQNATQRFLKDKIEQGDITEGDMQTILMRMTEEGVEETKEDLSERVPKRVRDEPSEEPAPASEDAMEM